MPRFSFAQQSWDVMAVAYGLNLVRRHVPVSEEKDFEMDMESYNRILCTLDKLVTYKQKTGKKIGVAPLCLNPEGEIMCSYGFLMEDGRLEPIALAA